MYGFKNTKENRIAWRNADIEQVKKRNSDVIVENYRDLIILIYTNNVRGVDKPCLKVWRGSQSNPFANYYYSSLERRNEAISEQKARADEHVKYDEERKAEKKAYVHEMKIDDILSASWGYDQTNIDFYQVVGFSGKKSVLIREIGAKLVEATGMDQGILEAIPNSFTNKDPMRKLVQRGGYVSIDSVRSASKSSGKEWCSWYH